MIALDFTRPPPALLVEATVRAALEEDLGRAGDLTTDADDAHGREIRRCRNGRDARGSLRSLKEGGDAA